MSCVLTAQTIVFIVRMANAFMGRWFAMEMMTAMIVAMKSLDAMVV